MRRSVTLVIAALAVALAASSPLCADDRTLWDFGTSLQFSVLGGTPYLPWRVDGSAAESGMVSIPAFRAAGILYDSNYIRISGGAKTSSDNFEVFSEADFEFLAFINLRMGGGIGTGWSAHPGNLVGLAINWSDDARPPEEIPFGGLVWNAWVSVPLKLSLEYFLLDPWSRLVVEAEPRLEYRALSSVGPGVAWVWHDDLGMNFNGFKLKVSTFFGYRPPGVWGLQEIGGEINVESWMFDVYSSSKSGAGGWGSDVPLVEAAARARFALDPWNSLFLRVSAGEYIVWTDASVSAHRYFGNRTYSKKDFGFKEATLIYTYTY